MSQPFHHTGNSQEGNNQPIFGPAAREDEVSLRSCIRKMLQGQDQLPTTTQPFPSFTPGSSQPFPIGEGHVASLACQSPSNLCSKGLIRGEKSIQLTLEVSRDSSQPVSSCLYIQNSSGDTSQWMFNTTGLISQPCLSLPPCLTSP